VLATDQSKMMLDQLRAKIHQIRNHDIQIEQWDANHGIPENIRAPVDVIFSNFGAVNCLDNLQDLEARLSPILKVGGHIVFTLMGRFCLWETIAGLKRLQPELLLRRPRGRALWNNPAARPLPVTYHSPDAIKKVFKSPYRVSLCKGIGVSLPPTYLFPFLERHPRLSQILQTIEKHIWRWPLSWSISDHYLIVLKKEHNATDSVEKIS